MERLGKLVKQLKEAVQTRHIAEVLDVEEYELEYDAQEGAITGHATVNVLVTGTDAVKGSVNWTLVEEVSKGVSRSLEYQMMGMLQDCVKHEQGVDLPDGSGYTPDWEVHGTVAWGNQAPFKLKRGETVQTEVEVEYRDEVG